VDEYDRRTFYPMFLKCYHHLNPMIEFVGFVNQIVDENYNLDIFQQPTCTCKSTKELVVRELFLFKCYQIDPKDIKCPLQWWGKHEAMFPIVGFLSYQISSIVGSQIEIERFFSLASILTNLKRCHF